MQKRKEMTERASLRGRGPEPRGPKGELPLSRRRSKYSEPGGMRG